jgi:hypothetical protein
MHHVTSLYEASPTTMSPALRALIGFAGLAQPSSSEGDRVMRTLASHEDWYVPVAFADRAWGQTHFDQVLLYPDAAPSGVLRVFTDRESALLADGQAIGVYGGPVAGSRLLRVLDTSLEGFFVNHASPREHQWYIYPQGYEIAVNWATTITVERALASRGNGPAPSAELVAHRYRLLLEKANRQPAQVFLPDIDGSVAVCFTADDRVEEFIASLPAPARHLAEFAPIDGAQLFEMARGLGASGVVVNAGSDDQTALTREDVAEILAA